MTTKFLYYSKSAGAKPGKGSGEYLNIGDDFTELSKIKNWRQTLSNFYISPFILDDNTWNSIEHFFHAVKFRNGKKDSENKNYDYYKTFALSGNRPWSVNPIFAKQAGKAGRVSEATHKVYDKKIGEYIGSITIDYQTFTQFVNYLQYLSFETFKHEKVL